MISRCGCGCGCGFAIRERSWQLGSARTSSICRFLCAQYRSTLMSLTGVFAPLPREDLSKFLSLSFGNCCTKNNKRTEKKNRKRDKKRHQIAICILRQFGCVSYYGAGVQESEAGGGVTWTTFSIFSCVTLNISPHQLARPPGPPSDASVVHWPLQHIGHSALLLSFSLL